MYSLMFSFSFHLDFYRHFFGNVDTSQMLAKYDVLVVLFVFVKFWSKPKMIYDVLATLDRFYRLLTTLNNLWLLLATYDNFWLLLATFGYFLLLWVPFSCFFPLKWQKILIKRFLARFRVHTYSPGTQMI